MDSKQKIERALGELSLITKREHSEEELQRWLEKNPITFELLGYKKTISHPTIKFEENKYIPDFMAQSQTELWEIIEIKKADAKILIESERRVRFTSSTESALSQCTEYSNCFRDKNTRDLFNFEYNSCCHRTPDITLIIGRNNFDRFQAHELLSGRTHTIKIITYDDIWKILESAHKAESHENNESGLFINFMATLIPNNIDESNYIIDIHNKEKEDRLQLLRHNNFIRMILTNKNGEISQIDTPSEIYNSIKNRHVEFCVTSEIKNKHTNTTLLIDNEPITSLQTYGHNFVIDSEHDMVIGSDKNGTFNSSMLLGIFLIITKNPKPHDKWILRNMIRFPFKDSEGHSYAHEYIGSKFMYNEGHSYFDTKSPHTHNLIQKTTSRKPILCYLNN